LFKRVFSSDSSSEEELSAISKINPTLLPKPSSTAAGNIKHSEQDPPTIANTEENSSESETSFEDRLKVLFGYTTSDEED